MIVIKLNPGKIEEVSFTGGTPAERAIEAATWPAIAPLIDRLDRKLRKICRAVLRQLELEESA